MSKRQDLDIVQSYTAASHRNAQVWGCLGVKKASADMVSDILARMGTLHSSASERGDFMPFYAGVWFGCVWGGCPGRSDEGSLRSRPTSERGYFMSFSASGESPPGILKKLSIKGSRMARLQQ